MPPVGFEPTISAGERPQAARLLRRPRGGVEAELYSFLNLGARRSSSGERHTPAALPQGERPSINCIGCWVVLRAGLDGYGKSRLPSTFDPRTVQPIAKY